MAVTEQSHTGNGSQTNYPFTFPYLKSTDVQVQVDSAVTTAWTFANATTVQFNSAPDDGAAIKILRKTNVDNLTATFYAGSAIKSEDLNDNFTQNLYVTQEVGNRSFENTGLSTMIGNLQMGEDTTIKFEGATDNAHETTLTVADPTADRTITLPNVTGTVVTTGDTDTVATAMIADDAVTAAKVADGAIDNAAKLGTGVVGSTKILDNAVITSKINNDAVTADKIADNAIDSEHYVDGSIDHVHLAGDAVDGDNIADDSINSEHIAAGAVDLEHMSSESVDEDNLHISNAGTNGQVLTKQSGNSGGLTWADAASNFGSQDIITTGHIDLGDASQIKIGAGDDLLLYHDNSTGHSYIKEVGTNELKIASTPQIGIISADASKTAATFNTDGGGVKLFHNSTAKFETTSTGATVTGTLIADLADDSIDTEHYAASSVDSTALAAGAVIEAKVGNDQITADKLADHASTDSSRAVTTDHIRDNAITIAKIGCEETTLTTNSDVKLPTSKAVADHVANVVDSVGGFKIVADKDSFPEAHPDPKGDAGMVISVTNPVGLVVNGSGVSTTGDTITSDGTVTINGLPSGVHSSTLTANYTLLLQTTSTAHTYDFYRFLAKDTDVLNLSDDIQDFGNRYRTAANRTADNSNTNDDGDLFYDQTANKMYVYEGAYDSGGAWKEVTSTGQFKILTMVTKDATSGLTLNGPADGGTDIVEFDLRDGSNAASVTQAAQLLISINGVIQKANSGTTISGSDEGFCLVDSNTIKFATAPNNGDSIFVHQSGSAVTLSVPADGSVTEAMLNANAPTNNYVLTADSSAASGFKWAEGGSGTITWTLGINGGADAFTFTGDGFASATDDPTLYVTRGETYKFVNGNSSGTHAFNIESYDYDGTGTSYTTGMTNAGATGGNTMTWVVPMNAPRNLRYVSGTTAGMTGEIIVSETEGAQGFRCTTGSTTKGLLITNGVNSNSRMAQFGLIDGGTAPAIYGSGSSTLTIADCDIVTTDASLLLENATGRGGKLSFHAADTSGGALINIEGPATYDETWTLKLPNAAPTVSGQALTATTAGVGSWTTISSTVLDGCGYQNDQTISSGTYEIGANKGVHSVGPITVEGTITVNGNWVVS